LKALKRDGALGPVRLPQKTLDLDRVLKRIKDVAHEVNERIRQVVETEAPANA